MVDYIKKKARLEPAFLLLEEPSKTVSKANLTFMPGMFSFTPIVFPSEASHTSRSPRALSLSLHKEVQIPTWRVLGSVKARWT